jgi:hypothetical protein
MTLRAVSLPQEIIGSAFVTGCRPQHTSLRVHRQYATVVCRRLTRLSRLAIYRFLECHTKIGEVKLRHALMRDTDASRRQDTEGHVVVCAPNGETHALIVYRLGRSVEYPQCGRTALSANLIAAYYERLSDETIVVPART